MAKKINVKEEQITCLVTGCAGFIGSHVTEMLLKHGYRVIGVDDLSTGQIRNVDHLAANSNFEFIKGDIRDLSLFNLIKKVDYVFHLAALPRITRSVDDPVTTHAVNVTGTLNVLEYCRKNKAKIIYSSSSSVYAANAPLPITEQAPLSPASPYAMHKLISEQYVRLYGQVYGVEYTMLRYFNVFGERQVLESEYAPVLGTFLRQKAAKEPLTIAGDGEQSRDFTYVKDVARANLGAMDWPKGVFNIGSGTKVTVNQIAAAVGGKVKHTPARPRDAKEKLAFIEKAKGQGWRPTKTILEWINDNV